MNHNLRVLFFFLLLVFKGVSQDNIQAIKAATALKDYPDSLISTLVVAAKTPEAKVSAIYTYLTFAYTLDYDQGLLEESSNVANVMKKSKLTPLELNEVFAWLCSKAQVPCFVVRGYSRDIFYKYGQIYTTPNYVWSVLLIDDQWKSIDVIRNYGIWSIQKKGINKLLNRYKVVFKRNINPIIEWQFPEQAVYINMPACPYWQIVPCEIPLSAFQKGFSDISDEFKRMGAIPCYNLKDSIVKEMSLSSFERTYMRAMNSFVFNEYNSLDLANAIVKDIKSKLDNPLIQLDSTMKFDFNNKLMYAKTLLKQQIGSFIQEQKSLLTSLYIDDSIKKGYLKQIRLGNSRTLAKDEKLVERNKQESQRLKQEIREFDLLNKKILAETLVDVKKSKKKTSDDEKLILQENIKQINTNRKVISQNKEYINDLTVLNYNTHKVLISKNYELMLSQHDTNANALKQVVYLTSLINYQADSVTYKLLGKLQSVKKNELFFTNQSNFEQLDLIKLNMGIIDSVYQDNLKLIKDNKRIIKKNKRLSMDDTVETALYLEENKSLIDDNKRLIATNEIRMNTNKSSIEFMTKEIKCMQVENKMIQQIQDNQAQSLAYIKKVKELAFNEKKAGVLAQINMCNQFTKLLKP